MLNIESFVHPVEVLFPVLESAEMHCRVQFGNFAKNEKFPDFYLSAPLKARHGEILILQKVFFEVAACSHSHKDISS